MKRVLFIAGLLMALMTSCEKKDGVVVNSSSILGDWVISNRVWEYIEDGKVVDAEEEPVEGQDDMVFTLVEDSDKFQAKLLHNSAESLNL